MGEHPNVAVARRGYRAFAEGDMETMRELTAEDVVWHEGGHNPLSGEYRGREAVLAFLDRIAGETEGTFDQEIHDLMATDEHCVALVRRTATRRGRRQQMNFVHIMHMRDGQMTEFWSFAEDQAAVDAFWS